MPKSAEVPPEEYLLEENEERSMIEPRSYDNPRLKDLISILIEWVNDELHGERIIVQDVEEDLYDGQVQDLQFTTYKQDTINRPFFYSLTSLGHNYNSVPLGINFNNEDLFKVPSTVNEPQHLNI